MPLLISIIYENATIYTCLITLTLAFHTPLLFSSPLATEKKLDQHRRQSSTSLITADRACRTVVYPSKKSRPPVFLFVCTEKVHVLCLCQGIDLGGLGAEASFLFYCYLLNVSPWLYLC
ncbi:hypothetical protein ACSBR2_020943 [Camellia fascicularis]